MPLFIKGNRKVSRSVGLIAKQLPTVNIDFSIGASSNLIQERKFDKKYLKTIQTARRPALRKYDEPEWLHCWDDSVTVWMSDFIVMVVFGVVRYLTIPVVLGISFIDKFVKSVFPPIRNVVRYNFKPVQIIDINDLPDEPEDSNKAQSLMVWEEHDPFLVVVARQTSIQTRPKGIVLVPTDTRRLVQLDHYCCGSVIRNERQPRALSTRSQTVHSIT